LLGKIGFGDSPVAVAEVDQTQGFHDVGGQQEKR